MRRKGPLFKNSTYFTPGWAEAVILIVLLLLGAVVGSVVTIPIMRFLGAAGTEYAELISYPIMFIPPILYANAQSRRNCMFEEAVAIDRNGFGAAGGLKCALAAAAGTLALGFVVDPVTVLLPQMPVFLEQALKSLTQGSLWVNFLCVSVMAPLFEEWLCRGTILRGLLGRGVKPFRAITASALIFAFIHLNPWQAVPAFCLGMLFGYVYYRTGSLKLTVLMHFTNNTFSLLMSRIPEFRDMTTWMDVFSGAGYWIIFASCVIVTVLTVQFFSKTGVKE